MALPHVSAGDKVYLGPVGPAAIETTKTHAIVKTDRFEAARLVLPAGAKIPPHAVAGQISLYCIEGAVLLAAGAIVEMGPGDWIYLDGGAQHGLEAKEDSSLLLTILFD